MRPVNLWYLSNISNEKLFSDYENILSARSSLTRIRRADQTALRSLVKTLKRSGLTDLLLLDGFFFSFTIDHIGKEFDLLKIGSGRSAVLNIELKSQDIGTDRILSQLLQNRYYLNTISGRILSFTYVSDTRRFCTLTEDETLRECGPEDLAAALREFREYESGDLGQLFESADYMISPVSTPERFIDRKYFLTNQQLFYKKELLNAIQTKKEEALFLGITGEPGTGKTLLLYDLAVTLSGEKKVLMIHGARLSAGHLRLRSALTSLTLVSIRDVTPEFLEENTFDVILVDETQRLYQVGFDCIVSSVMKQRSSCIFSYDRMQVLSVPEQERDISSQIELLTGDAVCTLSSRLRTNTEVAAFLNCLFNRKYRSRKFRYENIDLLRAASEEEQAALIRYYGSKGYVYCCAENMQEHIGQELEKVTVAVDGSFRYTSSGILTAERPEGSSFLPERVLYQNISRCREKLCLIVTGNDRLFRRVCTVLRDQAF